MSMTEEAAEDCVSCEGCAQYERVIDVMEKALEAMKVELANKQLELMAADAAANLAVMLLDAQRARRQG